ncbi:hypothetical protein RGQ29_024546 [Quercus rubra]|uniref:Uncharacterized protein n=1 Tax=Quercus rubra TaxID=3512 RepID=A0AAN7EVB0_QUERU|nr:hypothetical protein RGQ29_024546 [Quercus rubra]
MNQISNNLVLIESLLDLSQQEPHSSISIHTAVGFLIILLLTLLQVRGQSSGDPFQTHGATISAFVIAIFFYATALAVISQLTPNTRYLPILWHVCIIFGVLACGLLLRIIVPPFGLLILVLWVCTSLLLLYDSQILQSFSEATTNAFNTISEATSNAFDKLCVWFQDSFQSMRQEASGPFNSSSMPAANSTKTSGENGGFECSMRIARSISYVPMFP